MLVPVADQERSLKSFVEQLGFENGRTSSTPGSIAGSRWHPLARRTGLRWYPRARAHRLAGNIAPSALEVQDAEGTACESARPRSRCRSWDRDLAWACGFVIGIAASFCNPVRHGDA